MLHRSLGSNAGRSENDFGISGPKHLMMSPGNWASEEYCRSVAASLVKAAYVLETERGSGHVNKEMIAQGLARGWWVPFHFDLAEVISDDRTGDGYIFGAVFEYRPERANVERHPLAPTHVVAIRGTIIKGIRNARDLYDDMRVIFNAFNKMKRNHRTQQAVESVFSFWREHLRHGRVWFAGHSLGATCAMLAGKRVARELGLCVPTFLFNPPYVSLLPAVSKLVPDKAKAISWITRVRKAKVKVASLLRRRHPELIAQRFQHLMAWAPNMYLHDGDLISNGFVLDFEQRQAMAAAAGNGGDTSDLQHLLPSASLGALTSIREMVCDTSNLQHLLPSANMWINSGDAAAGSGSAHSLQQWWQPDAMLNLRSLQWSYEDNGQEAHC